jgi:hypothetical protein
MAVQMFVTHIPEQGHFGPWMSIERANGDRVTAVSVTAFRSDKADKKELLPIRGEFEWKEQAVDRAGRLERFNSGMIDIVLPPNAPPPRLRFIGEGCAGEDLQVVVQFRDLTCAEDAAVRA